MPGEVVDAADPQDVDGAADLLQRDTGVEEPLDDLEDEDVAEAVEPLRARTTGRAHRGVDEAGPGPVVELAVGDPGGLARGGTAVPDLVVELGEVVGEQHALGGDGSAPAVPRLLGGAHAYLLVCRLSRRLYARE